MYVFFGPVAGTIGLVDAPARIFGAQLGDRAGATLAAGADILGTGVESLLIGAPGGDSGTLDGGTLYVFPGGF